LAEQIFTRPYKDLSQFNNVGTAKLSSGCNGGCTFCPDGEIVADYRTPEQALEEIQTLAKMGARRIGFASANFPANYQKSSAIARILPPGIGYHYASRIDSQFFAITRNPDSWKRFAFGNHRGLTIDLGEETPLVDRLSPDRLRKYRTREQALQQNERLAAVLKFFRGSNTIFHLFEIPFDWKMTLAEALEHYREVNKFCALHEGQVELSFLGSYQLLTHAIGSPLSNSMSPLDYFRFERDPRALFLALVVRNRARQVEKWYDRGFFSRYGEHDRAMKLNEFAITVGTALLGLSTSQFNLNTVLDALQTKNEIAAEVAFFEQLGSNKGDEIRALSNGAFKKAFPAVTLPATNWVARAVEWLVS
jgi:hypothetical protein